MFQVHVRRLVEVQVLSSAPSQDALLENTSPRLLPIQSTKDIPLLEPLGIPLNPSDLKGIPSRLEKIKRLAN